LKKQGLNKRGLSITLTDSRKRDGKRDALKDFKISISTFSDGCFGLLL
jgi:hypothetical protein